MRRWIALFLIVLLPLRAWAGAAMPVQPEGAYSATSAIAVAETDHPCHGHMGNPALQADVAIDHTAPAGQDTDKGHALHAACTACDVCHTVAIDMPLPVWSHAGESQAVSVTSTVRFFSSDLRRDRKPPIV